uniref:Major facilitator superfamily (MFS) profile domain-containing protein n=1 Tax=Branchiostoma floridae TaxID=7739 RepID=C3ZI14_BRAFL|eukprot:XP_002591745.1 hypothetical protein BRAFLDRAFT_83517 [Branchiostoma floridae]
MVKSNFSASAASECTGTQNNTPPAGWTEDGEFEWNEWYQGQVLSGYFYGYICTQIFGGWLETRLGGKIVCGTSQLLGGLFTLLTPVAARGGVYALLAIRILVGFVAGITYPTHHGMWGKWAPIYERSRLMSITMAGANFGTVVVLPLSGYLADTYGWESVFYVTGCIPILWFVFWVIFVYDSPSSHPRIDPEEAKYIESHIETREVKSPPVPWLKLIRCVPLWAIVIGHTCSNWGFYTMLTNLPTYLKQILGFDIKAQTREAWQTVFWIGAGIYVFGGLVVLVFLRTDVQDWAKDPEEEKGANADGLPSDMNIASDLKLDNSSTRTSTTRL